MNKIVELGLSYHDIAFGKEIMPTLFAKQRENGRAYRFVISDLKGYVTDLSGLTLTMEIGLGTKRQAVEGRNLNSEQEGAFLIELPTIYDYGQGRYSLTITDGEKKLTTKNGRIMIEQSLIFDDGEGGDISFDLVEFQKRLEEQEQYLEQMVLHEKNTNEYKELADKYAKASKESADLSLKIQGEMQTVFNSENERKENEDIRIAQELERVNEEIKRVNKENERNEIESKRVSDELERINSEDIRKENENKRIAAEDIREGNEKSRVSNHTAMQESIRRWSLLMQDWIAAEESRVLAESTRKDLFNQMKKEFDEMMALLGDNPIGNLTQEFQELKGVISKHFKSIVLEGDNLIAIREDLTELTIPLDLTKYATVKQLEELSSLLNTTKTQLQMKISNKADLTYVDEKLLNKADKTYVDEKLLDKADVTDLVNYAKISQLNELKAELLLAIEQGSAETIKVYADIFSLGNSDVNDIILNTGKIGLVLKDITQSELNIWEELTTMEDVANSEEAMSAVANSTTAMNAVINSTTAMNAVINSTTAMNAVANSTTAMSAVANSTTAMNAVANSTSALQTIGDSDIAMMALINSPKTLTHSRFTEKTINGLVLSLSSAENTIPLLKFKDGTDGSGFENKPIYKLRNGNWNILKQFPKIATIIKSWTDVPIYYYPLD